MLVIGKGRVQLFLERSTEGIDSYPSWMRPLSGGIGFFHCETVAVLDRTSTDGVPFIDMGFEISETGKAPLQSGLRELSSEAGFVFSNRHSQGMRDWCSNPFFRKKMIVDKKQSETRRELCHKPLLSAKLSIALAGCMSSVPFALVEVVRCSG